jgi:adenylate kinase
VILLMGIAGSGKGTQAQLIVEDNGYHLVTMGQVLREYVSGEQKERMLSGELLSDEEVIEIVDKALESIPEKEEIILDGFPRTIPQAEWLLEQSKTGRFDLRIAFHLVASRAAVKQRLLGRARMDDKEDAIEKRFDEYERATAPLLSWFRDNGVNVIDINAERSVEDVHKEIDSYLT